MDVIVPICGMSTRYPGDTPKWAYKRRGTSMLQMSVAGLNGYDRLFVVHLKKHRQFISNVVPEGAICIELPEQTNSQVDTIYQSLRYIDSKSFIVKDCDNYVELDVSNLNTDFVGYYPLSKMTWMHVSNKSYLKIQSDNNLDIMIEKEVISTNFGVGVYGIQDRKQFCELFMRYNRSNRNLENMSQIMNYINYSGKMVKCIEVKNYIDWGTIHDWNAYADYLT